jgi:hypothetical protein
MELQLICLNIQALLVDNQSLLEKKNQQLMSQIYHTVLSSRKNTNGRRSITLRNLLRTPSHQLTKMLLVYGLVLLLKNLPHLITEEAITATLNTTTKICITSTTISFRPKLKVSQYM